MKNRIHKPHCLIDGNRVVDAIIDVIIYSPNNIIEHIPLVLTIKINTNSIAAAPMPVGYFPSTEIGVFVSHGVAGNIVVNICTYSRNKIYILARLHWLYYLS